MTDDENSVIIQTLGPTGKGLMAYSYHKGDRRDYKRDGWYNDDYELIGEDTDDVFFPNGTGLWMLGTSELNFTSSGEVLLDSQSFDLVDGNKLLGNPFPSSIYLTALVPEGADTITDDENTVIVQTLGPTGRGVAAFSYHRGDRRDYKREGWYNDDYELIGEDTDDFEIPAGMSLWTLGTKDLDMTVVTPFEDAE